jgi:predicted PurR-regulated permease PerM
MIGVMKDINVKFDIGGLISVAVTIGLFILMFEIRDLLLTLLVALVVATFAEGFVKAGKRIRFPRVLSVVCFYLVVVALFASLILFLVPVLIKELGSLQTLYPEITQYIENARLLQGIAEQDISVSRIFESENGSSVIQNLFRNISTLVGGLVNFIIIFVVSFYLSVQEGGIERFIRIIVPLKHENYAIDLWRRTRTKISAWFNGQLLLALILTLLTYLGLTIIGAPYALLLALLAGVFGMIPYGIVLALLVAVGITFINGGWQLAFIVFIMYLIIQQITDYVLQPLILKRLTGLPTLVVILSIIIAGSLAGVMGVIIAVPVAVFVLEIVHDREHSKRKILNELEHIENTNSTKDLDNSDYEE